MYKYEVKLPSEIIDLDYMMDMFKNCEYLKGSGEKLQALLISTFGQGGYKFIIDTLQEQVDNIKARQPSEE